MIGRRVKSRILILLISLLILSIVTFTVFKSLEKNVVYFLSPTEIKQNEDIDFGDYDMDVETLREELEAFSRSILEQEPFPISHDQIIHVVSVTDAIIESSRTGKLIKVS